MSIGPMRLVLGLVMTATLSFQSASNSGSAQNQGSAPDDWSQIDAFVGAEMTRRNLPGMAIAVTRGDQIIRVKGYGHDSEGRPITGDTPFYIASASKAFTAVAVMQLVDQGLVELDAPVRRYLPEFELNDPRAGEITVRQLLNHTSGMWEVGVRQWSLPQPEDLQQAVARLRPARLTAEPGTVHTYFNPNYSLAARLVEVVSVQAFDDYLLAQVFAPAGMTATKTVDFVNEVRDGVAQGHVYAFGRPIAAPGGPFFVGGAGGVVSTASDMAKWVVVQANDGRTPGGVQIVSPQALRETHTATAASGGYAFGWNVAPDGRISHSGGLTTYSAYVAFLEAGDGVVALSPSGDSNSARDAALGVLALRRGGAPRVTPDPAMPRLDLIAGVLLAANWAFTAWTLARTRRWAVKRRPAWRLALGAAPYALTPAAILVALPWLLGKVVPWSWIWLGYYYPVWTALLLSLAATSLLILAVRAWSLWRERPLKQA
jgi:CubicO group peptidase (beta-lactamase class C family)